VNEQPGGRRRGDTPVSHGLTIESLSDGTQGLRLVGEVDADNADELERALVPLVARGGEILVDCSAVTSMDSAALRVLVEMSDLLEGNDRVVLVSPSRRIVRELLIRGLQSLAHLDVRGSSWEQQTEGPGFGPGAAHRS
jgi:anti-anti-sigma factor